MLQPNVVLTGFMGTGKSTVGRLLAARLGYGFVDTDALIERRDSRSIAEIFRQDGQAAFRNWEKTIARDLAEQTGLVIATGGRLMLDADNAALLGRNGHVFCLTADPETILARVMGEDSKRPLLDVPDPADQINRLLEERAEAYGRYPQINTTGKIPAEIVEIIMLKLAAKDPSIDMTFSS